MKKYQQCKLGRNGKTTTAWIEQRGCIVDALVVLKIHPVNETWRVIEVFDPVMDEDQLKEHKAMHRGSLPSVEPIS